MPFKHGGIIVIDFHSHILPGIDDGSRNIEETKQMIHEEINQGVTRIIATPHFYASRTSASHFLDTRRQNEEQLREALQDMDQAPEVRVAAEVYYFPGIGRADILDDLTIQGTNILLVEMPFTQWKEEMYREIKDLIRKRKFTLILVHVERYYDFQKDRLTWDKIMALPLIAQINSGSFIKKGFLDKKHRWAMNFLDNHEKVLLGTDCHNMDTRKPNMGPGRKSIVKTLGQETLDRIDSLGQSLLGDVR